MKKSKIISAALAAVMLFASVFIPVNSLAASSQTGRHCVYTPRLILPVSVTSQQKNTLD